MRKLFFLYFILLIACSNDKKEVKKLFAIDQVKKYQAGRVIAFEN